MKYTVHKLRLLHNIHSKCVCDHPFIVVNLAQCGQEGDANGQHRQHQRQAHPAGNQLFQRRGRVSCQHVVSTKNMREDLFKVGRQPKQNRLLGLPQRERERDRQRERER